MWSLNAIFLFVFLSMTMTTNAEYWIDDPQDVGFNCNGTVTDAVCCSDHLCDHLSQTACEGARPQNLLCHWNQQLQKCFPSKDYQGNVCCQNDPGSSACHDILIKQKCPEGYEVKASCCQNTKWRGLKTRDGYVCCNAPCKDADANDQECTPPPRCMQRSLPMGGVSAQEYGISSSYVYGPQTYGSNYADIYKKIDNTAEYQNYKTPEVTADDIVEMIVKAIENDDDVVYHDETLRTSPYGKYSYQTYPNYGYNFINPEFEYKQAMKGAPSIYHAPYSGGYGIYGGFPYNRGYGGSYGNHYGSYGNRYGSYGNQYGSYGSQYGGQYGYGGDSYGYEPQYYY